MAPITVLVVEDDAAIRRGIVDALSYAGYRTLDAGTAREGERLALTSPYDLMLLDLVLPDGSGLEILAAVRNVRPAQPVIVLTARGDERDRVAGLRAGADDYVVKPFSVKELLARIEAVLRRCPGRPQGTGLCDAPGVQIDFDRRELRFEEDAAAVELSEREADLLRYLALNRGRAIAREELLAHVWKIEPRGVSTRTIDMHVARLRTKLRDDPHDPKILRTVRGLGYMFG